MAPKTLPRLRPAALAALCALLPCLAAGADRSVVCVDNVHRGPDVQRATVTLTPLDDPHNPFSGDYAAWDRWVYANAVSCTDDRIEAYYRNAASHGSLVLSASVDSSGNLVPLVLAEERRLHSYAAADNSEAFPAAWRYTLYAVGPPDAALQAGYRRAVLKLRAQYSLPIPAWLAANPPAWALVLPPEAGAHAGEVVMLGAPGEDPGFELPPGEDRPGGLAKVWRRYSPDGKLLATSKPNQEWWEFYAPNPAVSPADGEPTIYRVFEADGIIAVTDTRTSQPAWLMNFDGTRLPDQRHPAPRNRNHWLGFTAREAAAIYAIQQGKPLPAPGGGAAREPHATPPPLGGRG
jgi:hypothetical protein